MALLTRTTLYVAVPGDNGDIPDRAAFCSLLHISAVETLSGNGRV
jgi:hypothetical protein